MGVALDIMPDQWWIGIMGVLLALVVWLVRRDRDSIDTKTDSVISKLSGVEKELQTIRERMPNFATLDQVDHRVSVVRSEWRADRGDLIRQLERIETKLDQAIAAR